MLANLAEVSYQILVRRKRARMQFQMREDLMFEYTFQTLFKKPSKAWLKSKETGNVTYPYRLLLEKELQKPSMDKMKSALTSELPQLSSD
jgi:hypothetical protein